VQAAVEAHDRAALGLIFREVELAVIERVEGQSGHFLAGNEHEGLQ
jgi:hypothetical protein